MSSTIAELLVKIGADNAGLKTVLVDSKSGIQTAFSANPVNEFTGAMNGATNSISSMIGKFSGLAALTAGGFGLGSIVQSAVDAGESVYQLSTRMGISAGEGVELSRILKLTGGDTQTFSAAMLRLDKSYSSSNEAGERCRAVLDAVGVSLKDGNGKLLPLNQQLEQLSKGYQVAAASGQQEEFLMNTLGARGLALANTLKDYSEAKEAASKVKGVGLDPAQMHELDIEMKALSMEASQVGLAFTGALAPVAQEVFPPIMSGLQNTAAFLSQNKSGVVELTKDVLEFAVAYKSVQLLSSAAGKIGNVWQTAAAQAEISIAATGTATEKLTAQQERSISRAVSASNKGYAKMEADAVKAAQAMGLKTEEYAALVSEKSTQIATEASLAAEKIRTNMTAAFLQSNASAVESAAIINEAIASTGAAATEAAAIKTAATTESAELCTAAVAESSAAQLAAIEEKAAAERLAAGQSVAANELAAGSANTAAAAQRELAVATALPGNAAVIAGEKTAGAMATAGVAVNNLKASVLALMGGWLGVAAATGYAIYKLIDYAQTKNKVDSYNPNAEVFKSDDGKYYKKRQYTGEQQYDFFGNQVDNANNYEYVELSSAELEEQQGWEYKKTHAMDNNFNFPSVDLSGIAGMGGNKKTGKTDAEKEWEKLQKQAEQVNKEIDSAYQEVIDNKIQKIDDWYNAEKAKLDASASANSRYEEEVSELDTVYAEKHRKAYADMLANSTNIWIDAAKNARTLHDLLSTSGLEGPQRELVELQNQYNDALAETIEKYKKLSVAYMEMDTESRTQYLLANPDVKANDDGSLDFSKLIDTENLAHTREYELKLRNYHKEEKDYEYALDKAYNDRSMTELQSLLNSQAATQAQYRAGQTAAMKEYYDLWTKTHRTSMDEMAEKAQILESGLVSMFDSIGDSINSAGDLVKSFGKVIIDTIWKVKAEELAAQISLNIFGSALGGGKTAGIPTASPSYALSAGLQGYLAGTPVKFAEGGIVTGPTLGMIGEAGYSEAVIPLTANGLKNAGLSGTTPNVRINITNNTDSEVTADNTGVTADADGYIIDVVLNAAATNKKGFNRNLKTALGVS